MCMCMRAAVESTTHSISHSSILFNKELLQARAIANCNIDLQMSDEKMKSPGVPASALDLYPQVVLKCDAVLQGTRAMDTCYAFYAF